MKVMNTINIDIKSSLKPLATWVVLVTVIIELMITLGCIGYYYYPQEQKSTANLIIRVTLIIDFGRYEAELYAGNKTYWYFNSTDNNNNSFEIVTSDNNAITVWIFNNISVGGGGGGRNRGDSYYEPTTVFGVLKKASDLVGFELKYRSYYYGLFVESIGGVENGKDNHYWQYWVNDNYGEVASDKKKIHDGDVIEWRYALNPFTTTMTTTTIK